MRLARLVAAGLAVGVVTGFVAALVRPRPGSPSAVGSLNTTGGDAAPLTSSASAGDDGTVVDIRSHGPVTG